MAHLLALAINLATFHLIGEWIALDAIHAHAPLLIERITTVVVR